MQSKSIRFDDENLAKQIEQLSQHELDSLPFGVILLDREGTVMFYSQTEARKSGLRQNSDRGKSFRNITLHGAE